MDDQIKVGHPFYFPTQVILVDDDADFLDGVSLMLNDDTSYRLFQSATEALDYVNNAHKQVSFLQRCYSNYKTGPQESDSLSHVDIGKLHEEIYNPARFQTSSTVIVDYSMPEMNGLEFLMSLENPFIKKILLTGQADTELAIKAFNRHLIDQFIDKHDPRLKQTLNAALAAFQDQYFRSSYKLITDPIVASHHDAFLADGGFQDFFNEMLVKTGSIEYYMIDYPNAGYLMVDAFGKRHCLLIYSDNSLAEHAAQLVEFNAPDTLVQAVRRGERLPTFNVQDDKLNGEHPFIMEWEQHYFQGTKTGARKNFYATVMAEDKLPESYKRDIIPYRDFLESNSLSKEIIH